MSLVCKIFLGTILEFYNIKMFYFEFSSTYFIFSWQQFFNTITKKNQKFLFKDLVFFFKYIQVIVLVYFYFTQSSKLFYTKFVYIFIVLYIYTTTYQQNFNSLKTLFQKYIEFKQSHNSFNYLQYTRELYIFGKMSTYFIHLKLSFK